MSGWAAGRLVAFDTETTGLDVETARIVTAYLGDGGPGELSWLIDPQVDIPPEATAVHGVTTEMARSRGMSAAAAISEIVAALTKALQAGVAVVTYNVPYDFTLLDRECHRWEIPSLEDRLAGAPSPLIDPLVLDKSVDRYRPGGRHLADACRVYDVPLQSAHDARSDALAALGVARSLASRYPDVANLPPRDLHELQVGTARDQAANLQAYLRRQGNADQVVDGAWPVRPSPGEGARREAPRA
ncbi:MAG: exonuclease domain-containing protein [Candidatus Dormiibacterota bacterium]